MRIFFFWNSTYAVSRWTALALPGVGAPRLCANSEIAWFYAEALRELVGRDNVIALSMGDRLWRDANGKALPKVGDFDIGPEDLLIGHIGLWAQDAQELGLRNLPMIAWPNKMGWPYSRFVYHEQHQAVLDAAPRFVPLCGHQIVEESKKDPLLARWAHKGHFIELGFSHDLFPVVKRKFNPPGKRGFLYVGQVSEQKGTGPLIEAFKKLGYPLYVGNGEWPKGKSPDAPNIEVLDWVDNADQAFWQDIATKADFFISPSLWDCQPVSPMENRARGFPVIGTPCSCIENAIPLKPDLSDLVEVCKKWQHAPTNDVIEMQTKQHTWRPWLGADSVGEDLKAAIRRYLVGDMLAVAP